MAWISGWSYRKKVTITAGTGAGTDYQMKWRVYKGSGTDAAAVVYLGDKCASFPNDITFAGSNGTTVLDHWFETNIGSDSTYRDFWIEVKEDLGSNRDIYIYYGKSGQATAIDGAATFPFFDDFPGTSLDTTKWDYSETPGVSGGILTLNAQNEYIKSKTTHGTGTALRARYYSTGSSENYLGNIFQYGDFDTLNSNLRFRDGKQSGSEYFYVRSYNDTGTEQSTTLSAMERDYAVYEMQRNSTTSIIFLKNNSSVATHSTRVGTLARNVGFYRAGTYADILADWVLVRKFVSPEPAVGTAGSEQVAHKRSAFFPFM